ncbi:MAG: response regulator [Oscillospiraceae bacterium]|nr:response regulator [Oscillospiraceae bacterium]
MEEQGKEVVIIVDDSATNLAMVKNTCSERYDVITIASCTELMKILEIVSPDIILLDIEMPDMSGYDVMRDIKGRAETKHFPVIFLTSRKDPASELEGLTLGAVDYIHKPFSPPLLLKRIEHHLLIEAQKREIEELSGDLHTIIGERTEDVIALEEAMHRIFAEEAGREGVTGEQAVKMREYLLGEAEKIINEGDALRFVPKPEAIVREREREFRIMLEKMLG